MSFWERVCDEMRRISQDDPEVKEAIYWIDEKCKITKESFYDAMFKIIYGNDSNRKFKN